MTTHLQPVFDLIKDITPPAREITDKPRRSRIVEVAVKNQYGSLRFYPANAIAFSFLRIQGGRTLSQDTLKYVKELGYQVKFNQEEIRI